MIDFQTARDMAQTFLDEDMHHEGDRFVIIDEKVYEQGCVVFPLSIRAVQ